MSLCRSLHATDSSMPCKMRLRLELGVCRVLLYCSLQHDIAALCALIHVLGAMYSRTLCDNGAGTFFWHGCWVHEVTEEVFVKQDSVRQPASSRAQKEA
jgi:hypothetical protein